MTKTPHEKKTPKCNYGNADGVRSSYAKQTLLSYLQPRAFAAHVRIRVLSNSTAGVYRTRESQRAQNSACFTLNIRPPHLGHASTSKKILHLRHSLKLGLQPLPPPVIFPNSRVVSYGLCLKVFSASAVAAFFLGIVAFEGLERPTTLSGLR